jgi:hypothetical protein
MRIYPAVTTFPLEDFELDSVISILLLRSISRVEARVIHTFRWLSGAQTRRPKINVLSDCR